MNLDYDNRGSHVADLQQWQQTSQNGQVVSSRWELIEKLGSGSFGTVYKGKDLLTTDVVAVKLAPSGPGVAPLINEGTVYNALQSRYGNHRGFARFSYCGIRRDHSACLVIERLGKPIDHVLQDHKLKHGRFFPMKLTAEVGIQLIKHVRDLHRIGYLHCDIKPNNVLSGRNHASRMHLVDFGLCKPYLDKYANHIVYSGGHGVLVTEYSSFSLLCGHPPGRRDDLESIGLCLIFLSRGSLPWTAGIPGRVGQNLVHNIRDAVSKCSVRSMCIGMGPCVEAYFAYLRSLTFCAEPDYEYLIHCLNSAKREET